MNTPLGCWDGTLEGISLANSFRFSDGVAEGMSDGIMDGTSDGGSDRDREVLSTKR